MEMKGPENGEDATKAVPAVSEAPRPPRKRRSDRYRAEEGTAAEEAAPSAPVRYAGRPAAESDSATAREVARRFRLEEMDGSAARPGTGRNASRQGNTGNRENDNSPFAAREQMGYMPGRMGMTGRGRMSEESRARLAAESRSIGGSSARLRNADPLGGASRGGRNPDDPEGTAEAAERRGRLPAVLTVLLLAVGLGLILLLALPADSGSPLGSLRQALTGAGRDTVQTVQVPVFSAEAADSVAPTDVVFTVAVEGNSSPVLRLVDQDDREIPAERMGAEGAASSIQTLHWDLREAWEGTVRLQIRTGEEWQDTGKQVEIRVLAEKILPEVTVTPESVVFTTGEPSQIPMTEPPAAETEAPFREDETWNAEAEGTNEGSGAAAAEEGGSNLPAAADAVITAEPEGAGDAPTEAAAAETADVQKEEAAAEAAGEPEEEEGEEAPALLTGGVDEDDPERLLAADSAEMPETSDAENAETLAIEPVAAGSVAADSAAAAMPEPSEAAAEPTEEPTARPILAVSAAESASPGLISSTQIYNGNKKVKEYARASADQVQMPTLGEYTRQKMGILTFRTDAFRQNAAIGTAEGLNTLELAWTAEAGSAKGASGTMYYGTGVGSQPAIIKWSKEVRELSDMYDAKKEKTGLREVIVAAQDGRIYFLDLSDGTATRNSIKLGYPMRSTPSLHPSGAPYMTVGQLARKMAKGTGTIGLRQYNLYNMKEMSLIDGLDAKNNRPFNNIGSFETSALIDRKSGTLVTAGTNGLLYVIKLNSEFDYGAGVYTQSPAQVVLRSKAKKEKDAETAVEASVAMYDRYVYYADMGGYLRCVDTNSMTVAWAVALGNAVESTPALDWHGSDGLDLYVATELTSKKRGEAEVKCFDALSGEERWSVGIGVAKDTKGKATAGFRASPVVGQNSLSEFVYYTVNLLSDDGREKLGISEKEKAALIALRKSDGSVAWSCGLTGNAYSSPVAVYSESGDGVIIQCCGDGTIRMLDGRTGRERAMLEIDGAIEASPAVYNNIMVIATSEKNKNNIYGIRIE